MIDRDLAELYGVQTRVLNQAVTRNKERFPADFMFSLTRAEISNLSQIVTGSTIKHAPSVRAFTEQGVAMLSTVLRSKRAIHVNIQVMRTFVQLRSLISTHKELQERLTALEKKLKGHDVKIHAVFEAIRQLMAPESAPQKEPIGFRPYH